MAKYIQCPECGSRHARSWKISEHVYENYFYFCVMRLEIEGLVHHTLNTYIETIRQSLKQQAN
jgi:hypothetical protein